MKTNILRLMLAFTFVLMLAVSSNALSLGGCAFHGECDVVWQMNKRFDEGVKSKSESLVGPAKQAFLEAMDQVFRDQINPMIEKINRDAADRIDQAGRVVKEAEEGIDKIITDGAQKASELEKKTVTDIKTQIINVVDKDANNLVDKVSADLSELVEKIDCAFTEQIGGIEIYIKEIFDTLPHPFDGCYARFGYRLSTPKADDYVDIYSITNCQQERDLDSSMSIGDMRRNYLRLLLLERRFACIVHTPSFSAQSNRRISYYSNQLAIWNLATK